jgi:zinc protease
LKNAPALLLAATLLVAAGLPAIGAPAAKAQATSSEVARIPVQEYTLPNGLKVLLVENHKAPVVSVQIWYRVGSRNEEIGKTGLAHVTEHMMFQGSKNFATGKYKELVEANGGDYNAFTTEDVTAYYATFSSDKLKLALELEADRLRGLLVPPSKFGSEVEVVKEERRWRTENSPFGMMWEVLGSTAYQAHPYRWPVVGWMSDLDGLVRQDAVDFYRRYYVPNNATLVVSGDFKAKEALPLIRSTFGKIPKGPQPPRVQTVEPKQMGERRSEIVRPVQTASAMIAYHIPAYGHSDLHVLQVMSNLLSNGESSRLYQDLVYERKIAQDVGTYMSKQIDPSLFLLYGTLLPGHGGAALEEGIYAQLERLKTEPVSERELQKAKNQVEASFVFGQQKAEQVANLLGEAATLKDYRLANQVVEGVRAVTPQDIMRVAKQTFTKENRSVVTLIPASSVGDSSKGTSSKGAGSSSKEEQQ